jgi:hypothetical protein
MEMHKIEISKDAKVKIEVTGVSGPACKAATERIQKALGHTVTDVETAEYYENAENVQAVNQS